MASAASSFQIRPAVSDDADALRQLWRELDRLHAEVQPAFFRLAERAKITADTQGSLMRQVFVAEVDDSDVKHLAGAVVVRIAHTPDEPPLVPAMRAMVEEIVVQRAYRRRGLGGALMAKAEAWAKARGAVQLVLTVWQGNQQAEQFYRRLGFAPVSQVLGRDVG